MGWADYPTEKVPKEVVHYMLDLIDRIQYAYLRTDGTYGDLANVVSNKVKLIEKKLWEAKEQEADKVIAELEDITSGKNAGSHLPRNSRSENEVQNDRRN